MERPAFLHATRRMYGGVASTRTLWIVALVTAGCAIGGMIWLFYGGGSPGGQAGPDSPETGQASRLAAVSTAEPDDIPSDFVGETTSILADAETPADFNEETPETAPLSDESSADPTIAAGPPEPERKEVSRVEEPPATPVAMKPAPEAAPVLPDVEPAAAAAISIPADVKPDAPVQPEAPATALQPESVAPPETMPAPSEIQPEPTATAEPMPEASASVASEPTLTLAPAGVEAAPGTETEDMPGDPAPPTTPPCLSRP